MSAPKYINSSIIPNLPEINEMMVEWARRRLELLGPDASGFADFYAKRVLDAGTLFGEYDVRVIESIMTRVGDFSQYVEAGPGLGQTLLTLALLGKSVMGIEPHPRRFASMNDLAATMTRAYPQIGDRVKLENGRFPDYPKGDCSGSLFYTCCFTFALNSDEDAAIVEGMRRFGACIIDLTRFIWPRRTPEHVAELRELLARKGFTTPEPLPCRDGQFVLLRQK